MEKALYAHLAGLLSYPREDIKSRTDECFKALASSGVEYPPEVGVELGRFQKDLEEMPLDDVQGVYSYTFELSADYSLDMGYHLFDGFKRANNLATVKTMYREQGFPFDQIAKGELPDHLPVLLLFLDFLREKDATLMKDFRQSFVILAMEKLNKNFEKNVKNLYRHLIGAIYRILEKDVKEAK
ncbi:MAG: hypothetical protein HY886_09925 [Deltaproteobacteria bacterium]|nr:hypothetical protein [Deltaproteobacteria bacterium]